MMNIGKERKIMNITATQFKTKFGVYLEKAREEDVIVYKNGKPYAKLSKIDESDITSQSLMSFYGAGKYPVNDYKEELHSGLKEKYESID